MSSILKIIVCGLVTFHVGCSGTEEFSHDLKAESLLLEQLAAPDSDTKINAAVALGEIFRNQKGLHPEVYKRILKMLAPESPHSEREGAAWVLGEMRYVEPATRKLMKQYELDAIAAGDISLSTVLMHSRERSRMSCRSLIRKNVERSLRF